MGDLLRHGYAADLTIRSGGDGRTVSGICVPFNTPTSVCDWGVRYQEQFAPGAFQRTIAHAGPQRVKFLAQHDRGAFPLGRAETLVDDPAKYPGLYGEFRVSKTERGDEALELIRDGALDGLSVGFAPVRSDPMNATSGALVTRHEVKLNEVSAVSFPAYDGARIEAVRGEDADRVLEALEALRDAPEIDGERLDDLMGAVMLHRAGKTLSAATVGSLQKVLDLAAAADKNLDQLLVDLSAFMGVTNPDIAQDAAEDAGRAAMSSADIDALPDEDFAYIEPGGSKDASGKTTPRSLRHFPIHDAAHVRNALSRPPQSPFGDKAMPKIKAAAAKFGITVGGRADDDEALARADYETRVLRARVHGVTI